MSKHSKKNAKSPDRLKVLFADDEPTIQELMSLELPRMGHEVTVCPDGLTAVAALERNTYDCLLVDLDMPGLNGIQVIERAKELCPEIEAVVLTGKSSLDSAIAALRQGAFDYLTKPCKLVELESLLSRIAQKRELQNRYRAVKRQLERFQGGTQSGRRQPVDGPRAAADRQGGAHQFDRADPGRDRHRQGTGRPGRCTSRASAASKPFVAVNCGALPESLIESELFGHRKGAFTGADEHRVGLFEVAHGGTIFLDEIGELPKAMQAKLLRVLECGEIRRIGDNESFRVDVRVVCATHRNLAEMVEAGEFREDLMYRINTFEIPLPPLRLRLDDIPALAYHLYRRFRPGPPTWTSSSFTPEAIEAPEVAHLARQRPRTGQRRSSTPRSCATTRRSAPNTCRTRFGARAARVPDLGPLTLRELEMHAIHQALERHDGNKVAAAEELGVSLKTLYNKLNQEAASERKSA